jgi:TrmH family RNA methyltransferase
MASTLVTQVRNLQRRKARKRSRFAVAEGVRLVEEAVAAGLEIQGAIVAAPALEHPRTAGLARDLASRAIDVEEVSERIFGDLTDSDSPQGILAVVAFPDWRLAALELRDGATLVVLDGVQDPGNVGTLIRTAFALGCAGALLLPGTADPRNPKVLRGAMGASFRMPVIQLTDEQFAAWIRDSGVVAWVADTEGTDATRSTRPARLALVVGNEGTGVRPFLSGLAKLRVAIPLARGAESLNVAVAAGILLHEVQRAV